MRLQCEEIRKRLEAKYGSVADIDLIPLDKADKELHLCDTCKGNGTCHKTNHSFFKPVISVSDGILEVGYAECKHGQAVRVLHQSKLAAVPDKYIGKGFADYQESADNTTALRISQWLAQEQPKQGAFFYGGVGTGKTMLAAIVAQEFIKDFKTVIFGDMPSLLAEIKATFGTGKTVEQLRRLIDVDLLVLDDAGAERVTDWSAEQLYLIINGRYNNEKPVLVTSNYDFNGLEARFGGDLIAQRIVSRLNEMTVQTFFGTKDWRS